MKKLLVTIVAIAFFAVALLPRQTFASSTLADTINNVLNQSSWSEDPSVIATELVFGKENASAFDSAITSQIQGEVGYVRVLAAENGYSSQTIDSQVKDMMSTINMSGYVPITLNGVWEDARRFMVPLYDVAPQWGLSSLWNKSEALAEVQSNLQTKMPLLGFSNSGGWQYASRYYDEWIQDLDLVLKMGDTATAAALWAGVNAAPPDGNWNGQNYIYRPSGWDDVLEGEVGFFACIVANYKETVGRVPNFDRVSLDLYNKLLVDGWNSPLWGVPAVVRHATSNPELRPDMTIGAVEALQMYYTVSDSTWKSSWISLLTGSTPAWQEYVQSSVFSNNDTLSTAVKPELLFLEGIIPDSGSLAIPTNEWQYEDWSSMMPSTLFRFDYNGRTIRIPVHAGNIKFCFGSSIASYNFPSDGVYQVQFGSDWNTVVSANKIGDLSGFHFLSAGAANGTIYIRADGSVDPPTAPIHTADKIAYTLTGGISSDVDGIVIERDNIILSGAGYPLTGNGNGNGITLTSRSNVTIRNITIKNFNNGIYLDSSSGNTLSGNNVTANNFGIYLDSSSGNTLSGNNVTANNEWGIVPFDSSGNFIFHNSFVDNAHTQVYSEGSNNTWDDGYPSGGNHWSDYTGVDVHSGVYQNETGSDGIGDTQYVIDENNTDHYPLMNPYALPPDVAVMNVSPFKTVVGVGYSLNVNVTAANPGGYPEIFNVTVYANATAIGSENIALSAGNSMSVAFTWNTTGFAYGNYTISAVADTVPNEADTTDNNCTCNIPVHVGVPGDISGPTQGVYDGTTNMRDVAYMITLFNTKPGAANWNPNADVNNDQVVNKEDIVIAIINFNQHE